MQHPLVVLRASLRLFPRSAPPPAFTASSFRSLSSTAPSHASSPPPAHPYLSQLRAQGTDTSPGAGPSSAGPFPLPSAADAQARAARIEATQRKWAQLGAAQKAGVVVTQSGSALIVLAGAGLFVLVAYAVGSELFSEASPTRVFEDCVERVRNDPELTSILLPPLLFHGTSTGTRARSRRISHSYSVDPSTGVETLFVRFWVEGADPSLPNGGREETWMDWGKKWVGPLIWEDSHHPGQYQPSLDADKEAALQAAAEKARAAEEDARRRKSWAGWLGASLSGAASAAVGGVWGGKAGLRGQRGEGEESPGLFRRQRKPRAGEFTTGEVVAELEKDRQTGHFIYKQLFVAIPDTHHPSYYRHNINTTTVIPPEEGEGQGLNRLRFWARTKTV
ncbi:hypothetical protein JCM8097_006742 [Rhodosporidiobolus ruineniae]